MSQSIGTIVLYKTTKEERATMEARADHCTPRETLPAMIVGINEDNSVNLHVELDGHGSIWKKECERGGEEGMWDFITE